MTTIALNYSQNLLEGLKGFLESFWRAAELSRQLEANRRIASMLRHEYPGLSDEQIISELNAKTIRRMYND